MLLIVIKLTLVFFVINHIHVNYNQIIMPELSYISTNCYLSPFQVSSFLGKL